MNLFFIFLISFTSSTFAQTAIEEFESSNKQFTISLYNELEKNENANFFFSPFSVQTILSLAQLGAKGETAEEMKKALYLPSKEKLEETMKTLQPSLKTDTLHSANKIYLQKGLKMKNEFQNIAKIFGSEWENVDFKKVLETAEKINDWVEQNSDHKIKNVVSKKILNNKTGSVLVNTLHLKADWSSRFKKSQTKMAEFCKNEKDKIEVPTMYQTDSYNYYESKEMDAKFLELPLKNDLTFTIVLPNEKGVSQFSKNAKIFDRPQYQNVPVWIALPKFKIESSFDLTDTLKSLGIEKAFKAKEADFSGIACEKGKLNINKVMQKAFIDVSEEGIETASATFVSRNLLFIGTKFIEQPKELKADHPFIFYIKLKNLVLFAGKVIDPKI